MHRFISVCLIAAAAQLFAQSPCDNLNPGFQVTVVGHVAHFGGSDSPNQNYNWNFSDGTFGYGPQPVHTYTTPGTYTACLVVWAWDPQTQDSCAADHCETVVIAGGGSPFDNLNANFEVSLDGSAATFHTPPTPDGQHYIWHFGNGSSSDSPEPTHTYSTPGIYTACLVVWAWNPQTQDTCYEDHCETVVIGGGGSPCDNLNAGFQVTVDGHVAHFGGSDSPNQHYNWNFGDGTFGDNAQPVHTYTNPGTYTACLVVWAWDPQTQDTCYEDHCETVVIGGGGSPCDNLNAGFQVTVDGHVAHFSGSNSTTQHYNWNFGDGTFGDNAQPVHTYTNPGTYTACLVVWAWDPQTQDTCYEDHCETVVIGGGGSPCDNLNAGFQVTVDGHVAHFGGSDSPNQSYNWSFGDGTFGFGPQPVHTYTNPGTYTACLVVWAWDPQTQDSCSADHCETVVIGGGGSPCDNLNADFQVTVDGQVAHFGGSDSPNQHYNWNFGDGTFGYGPQPVHTYAEPGTYTACLLVWAWNAQTQDTCFEDHCETVVIAGGGSPCDNLNASFQVTVDGQVAQFSSSASPNQTYIWNFGDNNFDYGSEAVHTYAEPGEYHPCLVIWAWDPAAQDSCSADHCETVLILPTRIEEPSTSGPLLAQPQPFTDHVGISGLGLSGDFQLSLVDMVGRIVDKRQVALTGEAELNYGQLPSGAYVLRIENAAGTRTLRLLKR